MESPLLLNNLSTAVSVSTATSTTNPATHLNDTPTSTTTSTSTCLSNDPSSPPSSSSGSLFPYSPLTSDLYGKRSILYGYGYGLNTSPNYTLRRQYQYQYQSPAQYQFRGSRERDGAVGNSIALGLSPLTSPSELFIKRQLNSNNTNSGINNSCIFPHSFSPNKSSSRATVNEFISPIISYNSFHDQQTHHQTQPNGHAVDDAEVSNIKPLFKKPTPRLAQRVISSNHNKTATLSSHATSASTASVLPATNDVADHHQQQEQQQQHSEENANNTTASDAHAISHSCGDSVAAPKTSPRDQLNRLVWCSYNGKYLSPPQEQERIGMRGRAASDPSITVSDSIESRHFKSSNNSMDATPTSQSQLNSSTSQLHSRPESESHESIPSASLEQLETLVKKANDSIASSNHDLLIQLYSHLMSTGASVEAVDRAVISLLNEPSRSLTMPLSPNTIQQPYSHGDADPQVESVKAALINAFQMIQQPIVVADNPSLIFSPTIPHPQLQPSITAPPRVPSESSSASQNVDSTTPSSTDAVTTRGSTSHEGERSINSVASIPQPHTASIEERSQSFSAGNENLLYSQVSPRSSQSHSVNQLQQQAAVTGEQKRLQQLQRISESLQLASKIVEPATGERAIMNMQRTQSSSSGCGTGINANNDNRHSQTHSRSQSLTSHPQLPINDNLIFSSAVSQDTHGQGETEAGVPLSTAPSLRQPNSAPAAVFATPLALSTGSALLFPPSQYNRKSSQLPPPHQHQKQQQQQQGFNHVYSYTAAAMDSSNAHTKHNDDGNAAVNGSGATGTEARARAGAERYSKVEGMDADDGDVNEYEDDDMDGDGEEDEDGDGEGDNDNENDASRSGMWLGKGDKAPGSSCHQCKTRRIDNDLYFCSMSHMKKGRPKARKDERLCRKKYCGRCLVKFYNENPPEKTGPLPLNTWACPGCRNLCSCAACRRQRQKRTAKALKLENKEAAKQAQKAAKQASKQLAQQAAASASASQSHHSNAPNTSNKKQQQQHHPAPRHVKHEDDKLGSEYVHKLQRQHQQHPQHHRLSEDQHHDQRAHDGVDNGSKKLSNVHPTQLLDPQLQLPQSTSQYSNLSSPAFPNNGYQNFQSVLQQQQHQIQNQGLPPPMTLQGNGNFVYHPSLYISDPQQQELLLQHQQQLLQLYQQQQVAQMIQQQYQHQQQQQQHQHAVMAAAQHQQVAGTSTSSATAPLQSHSEPHASATAALNTHSMLYPQHIQSMNGGVKSELMMGSSKDSSMPSAKGVSGAANDAVATATHSAAPQQASQHSHTPPAAGSSSLSHQTTNSNMNTNVNVKLTNNDIATNSHQQQPHRQQPKGTATTQPTLQLPQQHILPSASATLSASTSTPNVANMIQSPFMPHSLLSYSPAIGNQFLPHGSPLIPMNQSNHQFAPHPHAPSPFLQPYSIISPNQQYEMFGISPISTLTNRHISPTLLNTRLAASHNASASAYSLLPTATNDDSPATFLRNLTSSQYL